MFRLMHRKQALTSQEMKWQAQAGLYFPSCFQMGLVSVETSGLQLFVHIELQRFKDVKCL